MYICTKIEELNSEIFDAFWVGDKAGLEANFPFAEVAALGENMDTEIQRKRMFKRGFTEAKADPNQILWKVTRDSEVIGYLSGLKSKRSLIIQRGVYFRDPIEGTAWAFSKDYTRSLIKFCEDMGLSSIKPIYKAGSAIADISIAGIEAESLFKIESDVIRGNSRFLKVSFVPE